MASKSKGSSRRKASGRGRSRSWIGAAFRTILTLGIVAVAAFALWAWPRCSGTDCPDVAALRSYTPPQASRVFDGEGELLTHLAPERRIVIPLDRIPAHVAGAFLAVEDRRFFEHAGIDYRRVVGAAIRDIQTLSYEQGFSTITMQLARNVFPEHLSRAKTIRRKVWEVSLARQMEQEFSKREILEMYLNQIYLGEGYYGVEAAAQGYFGKSTLQLNHAEAAMLAALPKAPNSYNPRRNEVAAVRRRNLVLGLMGDAGLITSAEAEEGAAAPIVLAAPIEARGEAPYFIAAIRRELQERFGEGAETAGLRVYTGLDRRLQRSANAAVVDQIRAVERGEFGRFRGPDCSGDKVEEPGNCLQGLFVAIDNRNGDVLALVGGRDFGISQFDRVTQARRQAGSAFKPFVFATAISAGLPVSTQLLGPGAADYEGGYLPADHVSDETPVDMRDAMRLSSNRATVALGEQVGVSNVVRTARNMGLTTPIEAYPSTLLGAAEVIPIELAGAFSAFANNGVSVAPRLIQRVEDANGRLLWEAELRRTPVLSPGVAYLTTSLMQEVVDAGTGSRVRNHLPAHIPAAGKTGTTNDAADAWFVGYTADVTAAAWVGFDQRQRISGSAGGGSVAAPVWGRVMASYYERHAPPPYWIPPLDLVSVAIDRETGQVAEPGCPEEHVTVEWFIPGTEPREYCRLHAPSGLEGWARRGLRGLDRLFGR